MLKPLLSTWYACARELGAVDVSVKILVEMLGHGAYVLMWNKFLSLIDVVRGERR